MRLGMIGMGRMGSNMARRLLPAGHELVVYDVSPAAREAVAKDGAEAAGSLPDRSVFAPASMLRHGAYVLDRDASADDPEVILIASGSEVALIVKAAELLKNAGARARLVSMPSWRLFEDVPRDRVRESLLVVRCRDAPRGALPVRARVPHRDAKAGEREHEDVVRHAADRRDAVHRDERQRPEVSRRLLRRGTSAPWAS